MKHLTHPLFVAVLVGMLASCSLTEEELREQQLQEISDWTYDTFKGKNFDKLTSEELATVFTLTFLDMSKSISTIAANDMYADHYVSLNEDWQFNARGNRFQTMLNKDGINESTCLKYVRYKENDGEIFWWHLSRDMAKYYSYHHGDSFTDNSMTLIIEHLEDMGFQVGTGKEIEVMMYEENAFTIAVNIPLILANDHWNGQQDELKLQIKDRHAPLFELD
ncbi:MAG: hypothetical protein JXQ90_10140 [Cyclobacteriaceae bacterium]